MSFLQNLRRRSKDSDTFNLPLGGTNLVPGPDATRLAYLVKAGNGVQLEVNGDRMGSYEAVTGLTFAPDGIGMAYAAQNKKKWFVVFNGVKGEAWDEIGPFSPVISPDSKRVAYTARRGANQWFAVIDQSVYGGPYTAFKSGGIVFSQDGERVIYAVKHGGEEFTVEDGIQRYAYTAIMDRSWTFSPDSDQVAYIAGVKGEWRKDAFVGEAAVVIDGDVKEPWPWDGTTGRDGLLGELYYSPDSKRLAYGVIQKGRKFFVVDGVAQKPYEGFESGWERDENWTGSSAFGKASCRTEMFTFSPDSQHYAYIGAQAGRSVFVYDGLEKAEHLRVMPRPVLFSPDSTKVAYGVVEGPAPFLMVNGTRVEPANQFILNEFSFSPDSRILAYIASSGMMSSCVVGNRTWSRRGVPVLGARLVWDDEEHFHTMVAQGREFSIARFERD